MQFPDSAAGEFGLDRISALPAPLPGLPGWGELALGGALLASGALWLAHAQRRRSAPALSP